MRGTFVSISNLKRAQSSNPSRRRAPSVFERNRFSSRLGSTKRSTVSSRGGNDFLH